MSLASQLTQLPPSSYALGLGLLITSPILFGNVGLSLCGPLPIIHDSLGPSHLSKKAKLRVWTLFYNAATPYIVGGTAATTIVHAAAAFVAPSPLTRDLSVCSAVASAIIIPWTLVAIMPTNKRLLELDGQEVLSAEEEGEVGVLLREWDWRHKVRFVGYGLGWASGLAALLGVVGGW
jgi:hypothetical protein